MQEIIGQYPLILDLITKTLKTYSLSSLGRFLQKNWFIIVNTKAYTLYVI
jgi:hypothetical protein